MAYAYVRRRLDRRESCICGHHIYKDMWNPLVGEVLQCEKDPHNAADRYSVAVKKRRSRRQTFTVKNIKTVLALLTEGGGTVDCNMYKLQHNTIRLPSLAHWKTQHRKQSLQSSAAETF